MDLFKIKTFQDRIQNIVCVLTKSNLVSKVALSILAHFQNLELESKSFTLLLVIKYRVQWANHWWIKVLDRHSVTHMSSNSYFA